MGYLIYGTGAEYEVEDRVLAHLKIAVIAKLRLQESFVLNWSLTPSDGSGRVSLWLSPSVPLQFRFSASKPPALNQRWLQALDHSSHTGHGMILMAEDQAESYLAESSALR